MRYAHEVHAYEVYPLDMHARKMHADKIPARKGALHVWEMYVCKVQLACERV